MPAIYAHDSFGRSVVSYLPPSFSEFYQKYPEAFRLGFQGPDILFYHKPLKSNPIKKRGMALHVDAAGGDFFHLQANIPRCKIRNKHNTISIWCPHSKYIFVFIVIYSFVASKIIISIVICSLMKIICG